MGCKTNCLLDCMYCGQHVIDVYSHLKYRPCPQARAAAAAEPQLCLFGEDEARGQQTFTDLT